MIPLIDHCRCRPEHAIFTSCLGLNDCLECQLYSNFAKFGISVKRHGAADVPCAKEPKTLLCCKKNRVTNSVGSANFAKFCKCSFHSALTQSNSALYPGISMMMTMQPPNLMHISQSRFCNHLTITTEKLHARPKVFRCVSKKQKLLRRVCMIDRFAMVQLVSVWPKRHVVMSEKGLQTIATGSSKFGVFVSTTYSIQTEHNNTLWTCYIITTRFYR